MYAIGQVRIESRQNILDLPEVFIPAAPSVEKTAFVVSNGFIYEEDGRYAVVRKSPAGRHEDEATPDGCSVLVEYESDYQFCRIVPLTEVVIALNALDAGGVAVMSKGLVKGRQEKNEGDAMKVGDFVSYWKGKKFAAHYESTQRWGYVEKINRKTARVIVFYTCFTTGPELMAFSYDNIPLECLRSEKAESRINTKWGVLSIQEIYQKACLEHKESVDALRTNAKAGHSASIDALRLLASCSAQVCSTEDFILDPRAELQRKRIRR